MTPEDIQAVIDLCKQEAEKAEAHGRELGGMRGPARYLAGGQAGRAQALREVIATLEAALISEQQQKASS